jgi:hypothetical protein
MRRFPRPSPALVISLLALFVALSGVGYAATGGNFILGQDNSATSQTRLVSNNAGKVLQLRQDSTATGASALGLNVKAGKPPLTTNSTTKVENLNADLVDGLDSGAFVQGGGRALFTKRTLTSSAAAQTLFSLPGFLELNAACTSTGSVFVSMRNQSADPIDVGSDQSDWTTTSAGAARIVAVYIDTATGDQGKLHTIQASQFYRLSPGGFPRTRLATFVVSAKPGPQGPPCLVQAQALAQG